MAHIIYRPAADQGAMQLIVNGVDLSGDVYAEGIELVDMSQYEGDPQVVGLRVTFALDGAEFGGCSPASESGFAAAVTELRSICDVIRKSSESNADAIARALDGAASRGKRSSR